MAQFKLSETDEKYLTLPQDAVVIYGGATGTETWIEREKDTVVRIAIKSVGVCTGNAGTLLASIEINGSAAKGQDGPAAIEAQLRVSQAVQVLVKAGERLAFKAYPTATNAIIMRTVVWVSDMEHNPERVEPPRAPPQNAPQPRPQDNRQPNPQ